MKLTKIMPRRPTSISSAEEPTVAVPNVESSSPEERRDAAKFAGQLAHLLEMAATLGQPVVPWLPAAPKRSGYFVQINSATARLSPAAERTRAQTLLFAEQLQIRPFINELQEKIERLRRKDITSEVFAAMQAEAEKMNTENGDETVTLSEPSDLLQFCRDPEGLASFPPNVLINAARLAKRIAKLFSDEGKAFNEPCRSIDAFAASGPRPADRTKISPPFYDDTN